MAGNNVIRIISDSRNLKELSFRPNEQHLSAGKDLGNARDIRYFRKNSLADRVDALIINGGFEIAR